MSRKLGRVVEVVEQVDVPWSSQREARLALRIRIATNADDQRRARTRARSWVWGIPAVCSVALVAVVGRGTFHGVKAPAGPTPALAVAPSVEESVAPSGADIVAVPQRAPALPSGSAPSVASLGGRVLYFDDGSRAIPTTEDTILTPRHVSSTSIQMELLAGSASFDVVGNSKRSFSVVAGDMVIEVRGTEFAVELLDEGTRVTVARGRARVRSGARRVELGATQSATFPSSAAVPPTRRRETASAEGARTDWRDLARRQDYDGAYQALADSPVAQRGAGIDDLLLMADVMRLSRHPGEAVDPLRQLIRRYPDDARAPVAAFALGRLLLDRLGRAGEAAVAFGDCQKLSPRGALAEDALAREVESLSRAGQREKARRRAGDYLVLYPQGKRSDSVRRFGEVP